MLTFELDTKDEKLEIHSDLEGLKQFHSLIGNLIEQSKEVENEHIHLMTKEWGGSELSSEKQNSEANLINHVNIFCWNE